jgi:hypothetical protein
VHRDLEEATASPEAVPPERITGRWLIVQGKGGVGRFNLEASRGLGGHAGGISMSACGGVSANLLYGFGHIIVQTSGRDVLSLDSAGDEGYGLFCRHSWDTIGIGDAAAANPN